MKLGKKDPKHVHAYEEPSRPLPKAVMDENSRTDQLSDIQDCLLCEALLCDTRTKIEHKYESLNIP